MALRSPGRHAEERALKYTRLGHSGLSVSRIALGCMSYGTPTWRPWVLDEAAAKPFFRRAIELGINFFDTADMYSLGVSEEVTGRALREYGRLDELVVATKVYFPMRGEVGPSMRGGAPNMSGLGRKHLVQACEASLRRLGVEAIDVYQLHRLDSTVPVEETLGALDMLLRQGKVRYLGASSAYAWQLMKALGLAELHHWPRFTSMQNHYNLVYREEEREMLPLCRAEGIGVIPWSPLARGMLAGARRRGEKPATPRADSDAALAGQLYDAPSDWAVVDATLQVAQARGVSAAEVALAWLLRQPGVSAPIVGATRLEHLEAAVRAVALQLSEEECRALEAPYQPHAVRGWL
jgi:1-deoxyxylulose-5-phosphate synthase